MKVLSCKLAFVSLYGMSNNNDNYDKHFFILFLPSSFKSVCTSADWRSSLSAKCKNNNIFLSGDSVALMSDCMDVQADLELHHLHAIIWSVSAPFLSCVKMFPRTLNDKISDISL